MNIKKLLTGLVVAGLVLFLLGWLVYGMLLDSYMHNNPGRIRVDRHQPVMYYVALANLIQGALMAYVFIRANVKSMMDGLVTGAIVGFLGVAAIDILLYGTTYVMSKRGIAADIAAFTAMSAVAGALLGMVYSKQKD